jgi:hypothetical protein
VRFVKFPALTDEAREIARGPLTRAAPSRNMGT